MAGSAEAKLVRYEIDGKVYSYSTNNRQQVREAQERINAAKGAKAAKERAEAEAAANPLVRIFGSPAQREAAEAQSRVGQAAAAVEQVDRDATSSLKRKRRSAKASEARTERRRALREARIERQRSARNARAQKRAALSAAPSPTESRKPRETPSEPRAQGETLAKVPAVESTQSISPPRNTPPESPPREPAAASLTDFVNQVRKPAQE